MFPRSASRDTRTWGGWGDRRLSPGGEMPRAPGVHPKKPRHEWPHCPQELLWVGVGHPGRTPGGVPGHWAALPAYLCRGEGSDALRTPPCQGTAVRWGQTWRPGGSQQQVLGPQCGRVRSRAPIPPPSSIFPRPDSQLQPEPQLLALLPSSAPPVGSPPSSLHLSRLGCLWWFLGTTALASPP